ncbi:MAG: hypothetical protein RIQ33_2359 [Bacteroidota bacterium]|jgi:hypothetical protein
MTSQIIIEQTKQWINDVVIGFNFCPFAKNEFVNETIKYVVLHHVNQKQSVEALMQECNWLNEHHETETTLVIFADSFLNFTNFLQLITSSENAIFKNNYEGIYQLAHFHPDYLFANSDENDAANFTNKSPYPMLHILRESSIDKALINYTDANKIPNRNIKVARKHGYEAMQKLLNNCKISSSN